MIGGGHGDRYSVGAGDGYDIIDDRGGGGNDTLILYTGDISNVLKHEWFTRDGGDLLVRVPNSSGGGLAIDIRIKGMGTTAGAIETVEIWGGEGDGATGEAWNLTALWEELTRASPPDRDEPGTTPPEVPGGAGDFTWSGGSGADIFTGTSGRDVARGLGNADAIGGAAGDDILMGNAGADTLNGGDDDDLLVDDDPGNLSADFLDGGRGDDTLYIYGAPSGGVDHGDGGAGHDLAYIDLSSRTRDWQLTTDDDGDITIRLKSGTSEGQIELFNIEVVAVEFGSGDDTAHTGDHQQAYLRGGGGDDHLSSEDEDDFLDGGAGNDHLDADTGVDWLDGGSGEDWADVDLSGEDEDLTYVAASAASAGGFTFANGTHIRNVENVNLITGSGDDRIWLGNGVDDVETRSGDDVIFTDLMGKDVVDGGSGNDRLVVDLSNSAERLRSSYDSSENDFEIYSGSQYASATRRVHASSIEELVLRGGSANDTLRGGTGDDELIGNGGNDSIRGGLGQDRLEGGAGDDDLQLDGGADWADGGSGNDYGSLERSGSSLNFYFDMRAAASSSGQSLVDGTFVRNIERWDVALGSGNDTVLATLASDRIITLGSGENRLIIDHQGKSSALFAASGVGSESFYYLASAGVFDTASDRLRTSGADIVLVYGGSGDDVVVGLGGNDVLDGGAGFDTLSGGGGNDTIDGGLGADRLGGGAGDDSYFVDNQGDLVFEGVGEGTDSVTATTGHYLFANVERLFLAAGAGDIFGVGNELANQIQGNEGANLLIAGAGDDQMWGGAGGDSLFGQDGADQLVGDAGIDYLVGGGGNDQLFGEADADALYGEDGDDILIGGSDFKTDILVGGAGNDVLRGDSGQADYDLMDGGSGNDSYYVDTGDDLTFEGVGGGTDTVYANVAGANNGVYLYANVENLVLLNTTKFGVGNELANIMTGSASGNWLLGGAGNDTLNGKGGNDVLFGEDGADTFVFERGTGGDVIGDFLAGTDKIDLRDFGFASFQAVINSMHEVNGTTAIDLGNGDLIVLNGVTSATLHAGDFILGGGSEAEEPFPASAGDAPGYMDTSDFLVGSDPHLPAYLLKLPYDPIFDFA